MLKLTTKQLIEITPFEEDVKKQALEKLPLMNEGQIFEFEQICWETIHNIVKTRVAARFEEEVRKMAKEGGTEAIDMAKIEDEVLSEFLKKLEESATKEEIEDVRTNLIQNLKTQNDQNVTNTPLQNNPAT